MAKISAELQARRGDAGHRRRRPPKKKIAHEIGQDLALLSVPELEERIALLKEEIARLRGAISPSKQALAQRRDQFFKK